MAANAPIAYRIKNFNVGSVAKFAAVIGFVWGFMTGIFILSSYVWGYTTNGQTSLLLSGFYAFGLMVMFGVIGGFIGGALLSLLYNRILGSKHGLRIELEPGS
jgi:hypothetical protein